MYWYREKVMSEEEEYMMVKDFGMIKDVEVWVL